MNRSKIFNYDGNYIAPKVTVITVALEKGFAQSSTIEDMGVIDGPDWD